MSRETIFLIFAAFTFLLYSLIEPLVFGTDKLNEGLGSTGMWLFYFVGVPILIILLSPFIRITHQILKNKDAVSKEDKLFQRLYVLSLLFIALAASTYDGHGFFQIH